ncbi:M48 family metallopeptidase [Pseudoalteromonas aurantia]|uniref:YgjP-like metallopeptidase domain-containing protein n=1 Tax=Pseudoalteromonas aurantia 208 TaxID=1314867 RepID=A0ABR9E958_9GAMM|nr:YgjP-like metallopeptidase domain-containing protein [Pseudoalteromonas aurantia]MBE0367506.1 hypothetical protein [Pseudoalteromonas aurantia 208]
MFEYQLKPSNRRRSIAIKVTEAGVVVHTPMGVSTHQLHSWLLSKQSWVLAQQKKLQTLPQLQVPWVSSKVRIFGEVYECHFHSTGESEVIHNKQTVNVCVRQPSNTAECRKALLSLLQSELERYVMSVLPTLAKNMGVCIASVKFREYKSRWGSCSSNKALTFNTLLVGAHKAAIEYVIIHELAHCHVLAHNHAFWQIVSRYCSDYQENVKWFRVSGRSLFISKAQ